MFYFGLSLSFDQAWPQVPIGFLMSNHRNMYEDVRIAVVNDERTVHQFNSCPIKPFALWVSNQEATCSSFNLLYITITNYYHYILLVLLLLLSHIITIISIITYDHHFLFYSFHLTWRIPVDPFAGCPKTWTVPQPPGGNHGKPPWQTTGSR